MIEKLNILTIYSCEGCVFNMKNDRCMFPDFSKYDGNWQREDRLDGARVPYKPCNYRIDYRDLAQHINSNPDMYNFIRGEVKR